MASDTPDIDPGEDGGIAETPPADGVIGAAIATGAAAACLACGAAIVGPYCAKCGQKNDDMRRSSLVLARDFLKDKFAFDSRMWRTLGLMARRRASFGGQFGVPYIFPVAMAALGVYFIAALKRAYKRSWVKTIYSAAFAGLLYLLVLSSVVGSIIANQIWQAAA